MKPNVSEQTGSRVDPVERRSFGRRRRHLQAFINAPGRPPMACIVRNISEAGALLELDHTYRLPTFFTIRIDSDRFSENCELRHTTDHGAGVFFLNVKVARGGLDSRFAQFSRLRRHH